MDLASASKAIYLKYYGLLEKRRWAIDQDIDWPAIQKHAEDQALLEMLYIASLIESYTFTTTPNFMQRHKDLPWIMALQMARGYEECKHGNALWRYLEAQNYPLDEARITAIQDVPDSFESMSLFERNVYSWLSEIETTVFYRKVSEQMQDPVGKRLLALISADERVHGSFLWDTLLAQIQIDPGLSQSFMRILQEYQNPDKESHYGAAVGEAIFKEVRQWANSVGVDQEVAEFIGAKVQHLSQQL